MFVKISNEKGLQSVCVQLFSKYVSWLLWLKPLRDQQPSVQQKTGLSFPGHVSLRGSSKKYRRTTERGTEDMALETWRGAANCYRGTVMENCSHKDQHIDCKGFAIAAPSEYDVNVCAPGLSALCSWCGLLHFQELI